MFQEFEAFIAESTTHGGRLPPLILTPPEKALCAAILAAAEANPALYTFLCAPASGKTFALEALQDFFSSRPRVG